MTTMTEPPVDERPAATKPAQSRLQSLMNFEITAKKVKRKELMHFSRQLSAFIKAGIPILGALDGITEEMTNKLFKSVLLDVRSRLASGETLASACRAHPEAFPDFYCGILASAEMTGNLDTVLLRLSEYIERELEARRRIVSALTYPAIIMGFAVVVVVVLTAFVLPRFETFFKSLHAKLPLATRILLEVAHFLTQRWYVPVGLVVLAMIGVLAMFRTERGREIRDRILLRLPVLGDVISHSLLERFCRILSSMVAAGVALPEALSVTSQATGNTVYRTRLAQAREVMMSGGGLAAPLSATGLFPASARQMFRVGEDTGTLDTQLEIAAEYFDRELDYKIKRMTGLFEPAVLLFVGLVVGFVAIALVSAMYGIFRQVKV